MNFTTEDIRDKYTEEIREKSNSANTSNADIRINPPGFIFNEKFFRRLPLIQDFTIYEDDTWVISFPKCGTTWTQEMVWLLRNNLDFEAARNVVIRERFPFLEIEPILDVEQETIGLMSVEAVGKLPRPRFIKSHLPPELLPPQIWTVKPKVIYVARNPNDAVISYYHHHRLWNGYVGSFEDFLDVFLADKVVYSPFWKHIVLYWNLREEKNVLFNFFEEMKQDLPTVVKRTAKFLEVTVTDDQVQQLCEHLSFKSMKNNKSVNYMDVGDIVKKANKIEDANLQFIRSGESGGWRNVLTKEMEDRIGDWTKKCLQGTGLDGYPWSKY